MPYEVYIILLIEVQKPIFQVKVASMLTLSWVQSEAA